NFPQIKQEPFLSEPPVCGTNSTISRNSSVSYPLQSPITFNPAGIYDFSESHETNKSNENTNSISLQANLISNNETHENVALSKKSDSIISASYDDSDADPWYLPSSDHSSEGSSHGNTKGNSKIALPHKEISSHYSSESHVEAFHETDCDGDQAKLELVESVKRKNYKDKLNYCLFCDKDVTHFVRHIITWHPTETVVQKILSMPVQSRQRRNTVACLRKQGNFLWYKKFYQCLYNLGKEETQ
ncbi:hypothetical protein QE152_g40948, partial [Popillia japonica]